MIDVDELVELTEEKESESPFKLGTVTGLFSIGTAKVKFDGEEDTSEKEYSYLASYKPNLNDRVILASVGGTYIILDAIYYQDTPKDEIGPVTVRIDNIDDEVAAINNKLNNMTYNDIKVSGYLQHTGGTTAETGVAFFGKEPSRQRTLATLSSGSTTEEIIKTVNNLKIILQGFGFIA